MTARLEIENVIRAVPSRRNDMHAIRQIVELKGHELQIHVPDAFSDQTVEVIILSARKNSAGADMKATPTMQRLLRKPMPTKDFEPMSRDECHAR